MLGNRAQRLIKLSMVFFSILVILTNYQLGLTEGLYQTIPTAAPPTSTISPSPTPLTLTATIVKSVTPTLTSVSPISSEVVPTSTEAPSDLASLTPPPVQSPIITPSVTAFPSPTPTQNPETATPASTNIIYCLLGIVLLVILAIVIYWIINSRRKDQV